MFGGILFGGAPFGGTSDAGSVLQVTAQVVIEVTHASLTVAARVATAASIALGSIASLTVGTDLASAGTRIPFSTSATTAPPYGSDITIDGVDVRGRVRKKGVTIRDVLNDAPNTCALVLEGDPPNVGQQLRVTLGSAPKRTLFAGTIQTVDQQYDLMPHQRAWALTAIDDTARANTKRPFGSWTEVSASTIAQSLTATFTTLSPAGIAPGLPPVSITFDGSDTMIAALVRLATLIGGYAKVEDGVIYLFLEDTSAPPDPLDEQHPPLDRPHITINTDASQLRTRVYGKGYGESILADTVANETILPIEDGAQFPVSGGSAIVGHQNEGAQWLRVTYTGIVLAGGGTLIGPGAAPGVAPQLALAAGAGVTSGPHSVTYVFVTAAGRSLPSPLSSIDVGALAGPTTAPVASPALPGLGPDEGTHDYLTTYVTAYGETTSGASSNPVQTSAVVSQLPPPGAPLVDTPQVGLGADAGYHDYKVTFLNVYGETQGGTTSYPINTANLVGLLPTPPAPWGHLEVMGAGVPNGQYKYAQTYINAYGETPASPPGEVCIAAPFNDGSGPKPYNQIWVGLSRGPAGTTGRRIYRQRAPLEGGAYGAFALVATVSENVSTEYLDTLPTSGAAPPSTNTTGAIAQRIPVSGIPVGPPGTTSRRLYRRFAQSGTWKLVTTLPNNSETTYTDATPNSALGVASPSTNTTGNIVQQVPLTAIPLGPLGVTSRKLYRRFNLAGAFYLVATLPNNTQTALTDTVPNSARGAAYSGVNTAIGNRIDVLTLPRGPSAVTARELYMSPATGGTRRLALTIPDNVSTSATIATSDAELAAALVEPVNDTSGLQQPTGQVNPGSPSLPLAAATTFRPEGGWVVLGGGQVVRYTGISAQSLIGIPATGPGAITTTVLYGQQAMPAPLMIGVSGVVVPLFTGADVHIWVQRDDLTAQAEQRARAGGDGIVEYLLTDSRRGQASLIDRCDADLALFSRPLVTVAYATRDVKTKSGKPITVTLPGFTVPGSLVIQDVTITDLERAVNLPPKFVVRASTVRFSLEDTLRRMLTIENKGIR